MTILLSVVFPNLRKLLASLSQASGSPHLMMYWRLFREFLQYFKKSTIQKLQLVLFLIYGWRGNNSQLTKSKQMTDGMKNIPWSIFKCFRFDQYKKITLYFPCINIISEGRAVPCAKNLILYPAYLRWSSSYQGRGSKTTFIDVQQTKVHTICIQNERET